MAIVSCPECDKRLKVADTSVGKKVKCSCGAIFVAEQADALAAAPPPAEKVLVACTECGTQLKVSAASLGKKVKCPRCAEAFVAAAERAAPKPALKPAAKNPAPEPEFGFQDDEKEAPPAKRRRPVDDDDNDAPKAKGKGKPKRSDDDENDKPAPVQPKSRLVLNLIVALLVLGYAGFFAAVYFKVIELNLPYSGTGPFHPKKGAAAPAPLPKNDEEKKVDEDKQGGEKDTNLPEIKKIDKDFGKGEKKDNEQKKTPEVKKIDEDKKDDEEKKIEEKKVDGVEPQAALRLRPIVVARAGSRRTRIGDPLALALSNEPGDARPPRA